MQRAKSEYTKTKEGLWIPFSLFIRLRDTYGDFCPCISCNTLVTFGTKNCQAGHFWSAGNFPAIEFDERNVNVQCYHCNMRMQGNFAGFQQGMIKKYSLKLVKKLNIQKHNNITRDVIMLRILTADYQAKANELIERYNVKI